MLKILNKKKIALYLGQDIMMIIINLKSQNELMI